MVEPTRTTQGYAAFVNCGDCGASMVLKDRGYGKFWGCTRYPDCPGIHGAHPNGRPMGKPADAATRKSRVKAHAAFDAHWKKKRWSKKTGYQWLQKRLRMDRHECHIARFDVATCAKVVQLCTQA